MTATAAAAGAPAAADTDSTAPAWVPWDDPNINSNAGVHPPDPKPAPAAAGHAGTKGLWDVNSDDEQDGRQQQQPAGVHAVPAKVAALKAKEAAEELQHKLKQQNGEEDDVDPLDAFMSAEVMPEVAARQAEEAAAREKARLTAAAALAAGKKLPSEKVLEEDSDEETPDLEIQIPTSRVKLLVGPGGATIKDIQKKSKARIQIRKEEEELNRAFGSGPVIQPQPQPYKGPKAPKGTQLLTAPMPLVTPVQPAAAGSNSYTAENNTNDKDGLEVLGDDEDEGSEQQQQQRQRQLTIIQIFGDDKAVERAVAMIEEAIANKGQKQRQRQAQYERKRDQKRRDRWGYITDSCRVLLRLVLQHSRLMAFEVQTAYWHV
eukprot:GHRR01013831.1.p1 GENE.GHRR01013831.1~~GHRR01013831.1.p1  ORF type:complete len:392 (+),score=150.40 GHRR01013831.1:52-1176(+)